MIQIFLYPPIVIEKSEKETTTNNDAVEINDIRGILNSKVYHFQITKKVKLKKLIDSILSQK